MPILPSNSRVSADVKFVALSITITFGIEVLANISSKSSHVLQAVGTVTLIASGYLDY